MSDSNSFLNNHQCEFNTNGGKCSICGKTLSQQLEESQIHYSYIQKVQCLENNLQQLKIEMDNIKNSKPAPPTVRLSVSEQQFLDYLYYQFPATVGHIPLKNMIYDIWLDGVKKACSIAEREERENELDTRISTRIKDLIK